MPHNNSHHNDNIRQRPHANGARPLILDARDLARFFRGISSPAIRSFMTVIIELYDGHDA
jgi:hypothetical protein